LATCLHSVLHTIVKRYDTVAAVFCLHIFHSLNCLFLTLISVPPLSLSLSPPPPLLSSPLISSHLISPLLSPLLIVSLLSSVEKRACDTQTLIWLVPYGNYGRACKWMRPTVAVCIYYPRGYSTIYSTRTYAYHVFSNCSVVAIIYTDSCFSFTHSLTHHPSARLSHLSLAILYSHS
jgi:hypothetical protein